jgi:myosin-5
VFKLEQQEYEREAISWSFVEFPDNQRCLDLIEDRTAGVLALLDEQCVVPKATDQSFAGRLYEKCKGHERFSVSARERVDFLFTVHHYAGAVTYNSAGFLDKNKDQLYQEAVDLLQASACPLTRTVLSAGSSTEVVAPASPMGTSGHPATPKATPSTPLGGSASSAVKRRSSVAPMTVGSQFKGQLALLLVKIRQTRPHYVRCLKPNDRNVRSEFDQGRIIEQLRCGGVLEAVRVSRAGFPTRMLHLQVRSGGTQGVTCTHVKQALAAFE